LNRSEFKKIVRFAAELGMESTQPNAYIIAHKMIKNILLEEAMQVEKTTMADCFFSCEVAIYNSLWFCDLFGAKNFSCLFAPWSELYNEYLEAVEVCAMLEAIEPDPFYLEVLSSGEDDNITVEDLENELEHRLMSDFELEQYFKLHEEIKPYVPFKTSHLRYGHFTLQTIVEAVEEDDFEYEPTSDTVLGVVKSLGL
jgi:hypothetical protein